MASCRIHKQKSRRASDHRKVDFLTVFGIFQGHALTFGDSKGHIPSLLFRAASNGTGLDPLGRREPRNTPIFQMSR